MHTPIAPVRYVKNAKIASAFHVKKKNAPNASTWAPLIHNTAGQSRPLAHTFSCSS